MILNGRPLNQVNIWAYSQLKQWILAHDLARRCMQYIGTYLIFGLIGIVSVGLDDHIYNPDVTPSRRKA